MCLTDELLEEVGAKLSVRGNLNIEQCLVALYEQTWKSLSPNNVFVRMEVKRDWTGAADITIPEMLTALRWDVDGESPILLTSRFGCEGILIRTEYEFMLKTIWHLVAENNGRRFGYRKIAFPRNSFPPYNPFSAFVMKKAEDTKIPGVVVTGTPGIGKTMFLYVILALKLIAKKTTVPQYAKDLFLIFHSNGVHSTKAFREKLANSLPLDTWFLFDSNQEVIAPPEMFHVAIRINARLMLVTASPRRERMYFPKDLTITKLWMKPFGLSELIMGRQLQFTTYEQTENDRQSFYDAYGPMAREAFRFAHNPKKYEKVIKFELQNTSSEDILEGARTSSIGSIIRGLTCKILHLFPMPNARDLVVSIPTQRLAILVMEELLERSEQEAITITRSFLLHSSTRGVAGSLLESLALMELPKGGQWTMELLSRTINKNKQAKIVHWKTHFEDNVCSLRLGYRGAFLEILKGRLRAPAATKFSPVPSSYFESGTLAMTNGFHIPIAKNRAAFDAYAYDAKSNHLVLFQVTCSKKHELKDECFEQLGITTADIVLITSYDGAEDVQAEPKVAAKVQNVYRLVLIPPLPW